MSIDSGCNNNHDNFPHDESVAKFISQHSYNLPDGRHVALVDGHTIYYFDHTTTHSSSFSYSHRKYYPDYSEYHIIDGDGKKYVVFTLVAARLLVPNLVIPDPQAVIVPVQSRMTLIYHHGAIETYSIGNRTPTMKWYGEQK